MANNNQSKSNNTGFSSANENEQQYKATKVDNRNPDDKKSDIERKEQKLVKK
jgi:hypothetical protein